jgi:hypothetical protein
MRGLATIGAAVLAGLLGANAAAADPVIGTSMSYGDAIGDDADERVATNLYAHVALGGGWIAGGELGGSIEAYTGGYGCGLATGDVVPAVARLCMQPGLSAHALFGSEASPSPASRLRVVLGVGVTSLFLLPGDGYETQRDTTASALVRASYLFELGAAFTGTWYLGAQLEERAVGLDHLSRSFGLVLEASTN